MSPPGVLLCALKGFGMKKLDVVALLADLPEDRLSRGQVGTIVEEWKPGVFEVEFADMNGQAYSFAAIPENQLMPLCFEPARQAA